MSIVKICFSKIYNEEAPLFREEDLSQLQSIHDGYLNEFDSPSGTLRVPSWRINEISLTKQGISALLESAYEQGRQDEKRRNQ